MTSRQRPESAGHDEFSVCDVVAGYDVAAGTLGPEYECLSFEEIHAPILDLLPESAGCVLDAARFAGKGHKVVAVESSTELREG